MKNKLEIRKFSTWSLNSISTLLRNLLKQIFAFLFSPVIFLQKGGVSGSEEFAGAGVETTLLLQLFVLETIFFSQIIEDEKPLSPWEIGFAEQTRARPSPKQYDFSSQRAKHEPEMRFAEKNERERIKYDWRHRRLFFQTLIFSILGLFDAINLIGMLE